MHKHATKSKSKSNAIKNNYSPTLQDSVEGRKKKEKKKTVEIFAKGR